MWLGEVAASFSASLWEGDPTSGKSGKGSGSSQAQAHPDFGETQAPGLLLVHSLGLWRWEWQNWAEGIPQHRGPGCPDLRASGLGGEGSTEWVGCQPGQNVTLRPAADAGLYGADEREAALVDMVNDGLEDLRRCCSHLIHHKRVSRPGWCSGLGWRDRTGPGPLQTATGITSFCRRRTKPNMFRSCRHT